LIFDLVVCSYLLAIMQLFNHINQSKHYSFNLIICLPGSWIRSLMVDS